MDKGKIHAISIVVCALCCIIFLVATITSEPIDYELTKYGLIEGAGSNDGIATVSLVAAVISGIVVWKTKG